MVEVIDRWPANDPEAKAGNIERHDKEADRVPRLLHGDSVRYDFDHRNYEVKDEDVEVVEEPQNVEAGEVITELIFTDEAIKEASAMETEEDRRSRVMRGRDIVEDLKSGKYPEIYSPREEPEVEKKGEVVSIVSDEAARKSEEVETKEARNARLAEGKTKKEEIEKGLKKDFPEMFKDRK